MNREKEDKIHILTYSIALHSIALIALLLSLQETSLFNKKKPAEIIFAQQEEQKKQQLIPKEPDKKEEKTKTTPYDPTTFTVPIPVMYYGNEVDPNKKPGAPGIEQKEKGEVVPPPLIKEPEKNIPSTAANATSLS